MNDRRRVKQIRLQYELHYAPATDVLPFTTMSTSPELTPYLNPAYWDGHMLGDGQTTAPHPDAYLVSAHNARLARFTRKALKEKLGAMHTYFPLQTFGTDELFDAEGFAPGTVTLFDTEVLWYKKAGDPPNLAQHATEIPERPTDLAPHLDAWGSAYVCHGDAELGVKYSRSIRWGVIVQDDERKGLFAISTTATSKLPSGRVVLDSLVPHPVPIEVGKTHHTKPTELRRTNVLHICMSGGTNREQQSPLRALFGRFAIGESPMPEAGH